MIFSENKGLPNLIQASIINKMCLFLAQLQHLEIQKSRRGRNCKFLIFFQDFAAFWLKKWSNLKKNQFSKSLRAKNSKMEVKIKIPASTSFLYC